MFSGWFSIWPTKSWDFFAFRGSENGPSNGPSRRLGCGQVMKGKLMTVEDRAGSGLVRRWDEPSSGFSQFSLFLACVFRFLVFWFCSFLLGVCKKTFFATIPRVEMQCYAVFRMALAMFGALSSGFTQLRSRRVLRHQQGSYDARHAARGVRCAKTGRNFLWVSHLTSLPLTNDEQRKSINPRLWFEC